MAIRRCSFKDILDVKIGNSSSANGTQSTYSQLQLLRVTLR